VLVTVWTSDSSVPECHHLSMVHGMTSFVLVTSAPSVAVFRPRLKTHLFNISSPYDCTVTPVASDTIIVLTYLLTFAKILVVVSCWFVVVLLYVREQHDHVFTALILESLTVHSLLLAVRTFDCHTVHTDH